MGVPRRKKIDWAQAAHLAISERDPALVGGLINDAEAAIFERRKNARPIDAIEEKELREAYRILLELRTEIMPNKIDTVTIRDALKAERAKLWAEFYDYPRRIELAIRIKAIDDEIAESLDEKKKRP